jgi:hypothetical protein
MESMEHPVRKRSVKPSRTAASGLPIGMPWTLPSEFARAHQSRSLMRLKPSLVNSHLLTQAVAGEDDRCGCNFAVRRRGHLALGCGTPGAFCDATFPAGALRSWDAFLRRRNTCCSLKRDNGAGYQQAGPIHLVQRPRLRDVVRYERLHNHLPYRRSPFAGPFPLGESKLSSCRYPVNPPL